MILDGMSQGEIVVPGGRDIAIFNEGVMKMPVEGLFDLVNIPYFGDASHADLLPALMITLRFGHLY